MLENVKNLTATRNCCRQWRVLVCVVTTASKFPMYSDYDAEADDKKDDKKWQERLEHHRFDSWSYMAGVMTSEADEWRRTTNQRCIRDSEKLGALFCGGSGRVNSVWREIGWEFFLAFYCSKCYSLMNFCVLFWTSSSTAYFESVV